MLNTQLITHPHPLPPPPKKAYLCNGQVMRNLYCLASELAFLVMQLSLSHDHTNQLAKVSMISPCMGDRNTLHLLSLCLVFCAIYS